MTCWILDIFLKLLSGCVAYAIYKEDFGSGVALVISKSATFVCLSLVNELLHIVRGLRGNNKRCSELSVSVLNIMCTLRPVLKTVTCAVTVLSCFIFRARLGHLHPRYGDRWRHTVPWHICVYCDAQAFVRSGSWMRHLFALHLTASRQRRWFLRTIYRIAKK